MLQNNRSTYIANKQGNKTATSSSLPISITLPPALNSNALSSLCRLSIASDCVVKWERFDCGTKEDAKEARLVHEALLQVVLAESKAFGESAIKDSANPSVLISRTLWAIESAPPPLDSGDNMEVFASTISGIWLFTLQDRHTRAETSVSATSDSRRHLSRCKEALQRRLSKFEARKEFGQCQLQDFYVPIASTSFNDPSLLLPSPGRDRLLHHFLKALKEHFLAKWVWTDDEQQKTETPFSDRRARKEEARDGDDEEEGAINDSRTYATQTSPESGNDYWPGNHHSQEKKVIRFAEGIILKPPKRISSMFVQDTINDSKVTYLTLRCFLDERGSVYVETRPQSAYDLQHIESDEVVSNRQALLAPNAIRATLVESLQGLSWAEKGERSEDEREVSDIKQTLLRMLEIRGINIEELGDDWMICETETKDKFLWPTKLCFGLPTNDATKSHEKTPFKLIIKPLRDIAERAKGLVRESIGGRNMIPSEDDMMLDVETLEEIGIKDEEEDEEIEQDADGQDAEQVELDRNQTSTTVESIPPKSSESSKETYGPFQNPFPSFPSRTNEDIKPVVSIKDEDDSDLWDTFGFGSHEDQGKESGRRQSIAGLDEGGFGLITEDDFDFFDAAVGPPFDDMDVDMGQQEEANSGGEMAAHYGDAEEDSLELAMTNSTFIDPPSLPGFTPGSLSATSPAVGGLNAKTPRTPFSPSQDLADANIAIEGEGDSTFVHDSRRFDHPHHESMMHNDMNVDALEARRNATIKSNKEDRQHWTSQSRGDLMSKYELGKFAMPLAPTRRRVEGEEGTESTRSEKENTLAPRNRLRSRFHHQARRLSGAKLALSRKSKFGALSLRNEEESSDLDATVDGTISERSSLMEDGSDEELTSASEDTSEEEVMILKERLNLLRVSVDALEAYSFSSRKEKVIETLEEREVDLIKDAEIARSLKRLANNPQYRSAVSSLQRRNGDLLARSSTIQLFSPLPTPPTNNTLNLLLSGSDSKKAIQILDPPQIMIGCQGSIATMESTALSFWEKLGLSAVSGPKEVAAMGLHCGCLPSTWQKELLDWFNTFNDTYKRNGLGNQTLIEDSLLALGDSDALSIAQILVQTHRHAEQWTDTLESLLSRMQRPLSEGKFVVIYTLGLQIVPGNLWILSKLEKDLQDLAQTRWNIAPELINVRGIAWATMANSTRAMAGASNIRKIALSIYDSLDVPVNANLNLKSHLPNIRLKPIGVIHPSFTLSPVNHLTRSAIQFQLQWKAEPFNLTDAGLMLHIAYHVADLPGQLSFIAIMDEKAQGYHVDGWRRRGNLQGELEHVWNQVEFYTRKARVLWRIVICKEGQMEMKEVKLWSKLFHQMPKSLRAIDITLTCIDTLTPLTLVLPRTNRSNVATLDMTGVGLRQAKEIDNRMAHFIDVKQVDYAISPSFRIPMCREFDDIVVLLPLQSSAIVSFSHKYNGSVSCTSTNYETIWSQAAPRHFWIHVLQVYQAPFSTYQDHLALENRTQIIIKSFHHLMFIAKERFLLHDNLPWHISMLATARRAHLLF